MVYWGKRGYIDEGRRKKMYSRLVMMGLEGSFYIIAALPFLVCWAVRFFRKEGKGAWKLAAGFLVFVL